MRKLIHAACCLSLVAVCAAAQTPPPEDKAAAPVDKMPAGDAGATISRSALCTAIADREPVGALDKEPYEFKADVGKVYFFNEAKVQNPPQTITHKWYLDDKPVAEIKLELKSPRARTWSSKNVGPGSWKVEAVSDSGKVLGSASFKVTP